MALLRPVRPRLVRRLAVATIAVGLLGGGSLATANAVVLTRAHGHVHGDPADLAHAQVAIVPGALVKSDGRLSTMLRDRVDGAIDLYRRGIVDKVLLSGDHHRLGYDEPDAMRDAVLAAGVPAQDVFTDYAGFNTWYTMERAHRVFRVDSAIVVTQHFHAARAVGLGLAAGLDIQAYPVDGAYGRKGVQAEVREVLARTKGLAQATARPAVTLGPTLPIEGDGRTSWGPADPLAPAYVADGPIALAE
jgi:SanA protein